MTTVRALKYNVVSEWVRQPSHRLLLVCAACFFAAALFAAAIIVRRPAPAVVETVTTGLDDSHAKAALAPVISTPQLPARDEDVERAGDKIAEATVYLSRRQKSGALRALSEARAAARRAYDRRSQLHDPASHKLLAAIKELEQAESAVERGAFPDAKQKLLALNRQLDQVEE
jgi:hypothetical protein